VPLVAARQTRVAHPSSEDFSRLRVSGDPRKGSASSLSVFDSTRNHSIVQLKDKKQLIEGRNLLE